MSRLQSSHRSCLILLSMASLLFIAHCSAAPKSTETASQAPSSIEAEQDALSPDIKPKLTVAERFATLPDYPTCHFSDETEGAADAAIEAEWFVEERPIPESSDKRQPTVIELLNAIAQPQKLALFLKEIKDLPGLIPLMRKTPINPLIVIFNNIQEMDATIPTLAYVMSQAKDQEIDKIAYVIRFTEPIRLAQMIDLVSITSRYDDQGQLLKTAAGQKLTRMIQTIHLRKLYRFVDMINYVDDLNKLARFIQYISIENAYKMAELINQIPDWPRKFDHWQEPAYPKYPKVVKLMNLIPLKPGSHTIQLLGYLGNHAQTTQLICLIALVPPEKLVELIQDVANTEKEGEALQKYELTTGKKLNLILEDIQRVEKLVYVLNHTKKIKSIAALINLLRQDNAALFSLLVNQEPNMNKLAYLFDHFDMELLLNKITPIPPAESIAPLIEQTLSEILP